jgi:hypothetical protein
MSAHTAKQSTSNLLTTFGNELKALAMRSEGKSRSVDGMNVDSFVATFMREHADLIASAEGPDIDNMRLISGRVSGDDDDSVHVVDGSHGADCLQRFENELLSYGGEDCKAEIFITLDCPLKAAIEQRLSRKDKWNT